MIFPVVCAQDDISYKPLKPMNGINLSFNSHRIPITIMVFFVKIKRLVKFPFSYFVIIQNIKSIFGPLGSCIPLQKLKYNIMVSVTPYAINSVWYKIVDAMVSISTQRFTEISIRSVIINLNMLRPRQNGHHFADDTFRRISLNENDRITIKISLNFVS